MTRFVAFAMRSYHTWHMRLKPILLSVLSMAILVMSPGLTNASFDLEEVQKAEHFQYPGESELRVTQSDGMSLSQATESVRRRTGGRVLSAETKIQGGREMHYIKVVKDGKVKTHQVKGRKVR